MGKKIIILGIDGGEFGIIDPLVEKGLMPNFKKILKGGCRGKLRSTFPPMTFPAWNTFMTGVNPGKHGVYDFTEHVEGKYGIVFTNAQSRQTKTIWKLLSDIGRRVAVMGVPLTYPPEKINGVMISGFDTPVGGMADESVFHPTSIRDELNEVVGGYEVSADITKAIENSDPVSAANNIKSTLAKKIRAASYLLDKEEWDLFMVLFGESDVASHHFWRHYDPQSPLLTGQRLPDCQTAIPEIYQQIDTFLGSILEKMDKDTVVLVMSDHGFGGNSNRAFYLNRWLEMHDFLTFLPEQVSQKIFSSMKKWGLRYIPQQLKVSIFRKFGRLADSTESVVRFGGIDWKGTIAYSEETPYYPGVWINLKGREPGGIVAAEDYDKTVALVKDNLSRWIDPVTETPVFKNVFRRGDIFDGPFVHKAPDILLEPNMIEGNSYLSRNSRSREKGVCLDFLSETEMNSNLVQMKSGSHRNEGIFVGYGGSFSAGTELTNASIIDLAPTIFTLMGVPVPKGWEGTSLTNGDQEAVETAEVDITSLKEKTEYSTEQAEQVRNRLRDLGYLE